MDENGDAGAGQQGRPGQRKLVGTLSPDGGKHDLGDAGVQLSQLCFERFQRHFRVHYPWENGICTSAYGQDVMPNGFNYNIVVTDSGTGASGLYSTTSALDIYVNGLDKTTGAIAEVPFTASYNAGFGSDDRHYTAAARATPTARHLLPAAAARTAMSLGI